MKGERAGRPVGAGTWEGHTALGRCCGWREDEGELSQGGQMGVEELERAQHSPALNPVARRWQNLSCRQAAWTGVSTFSNLGIQEFPPDSSPENPTNTPYAPLEVPRACRVEGGRGLGFQAGDPTLTPGACPQR